MNAIDLKNFINNNDIEYHWHNNDVILFVDIYNIMEWNELLGYRILTDGEINCRMKDGYFCFEMFYFDPIFSRDKIIS